MMLKKGFTLLELLIVVGIIGILIAISAASYLLLLEKARDSERKIDIDNIKYAVEQYRISNHYYPISLNQLLSPIHYLQKIPTDPASNQGYSYQYQALPNGCDNTSAATYCNDYRIGAELESTNTCTSPPATRCTATSNCNYCLGPYGEFTN